MTHRLTIANSLPLNAKGGTPGSTFHQFNQPGDYIATLQITTVQNQLYRWLTHVTVSDLMPEIMLVAQDSASCGEDILLMGRAMDDAGAYLSWDLDGFPGIEMMRNGPSRGITFSWREVADPTAALGDRDLLLAMRQDLGTAMHDEELVPQTLVWRDAEIGGVACVKLEGAWNSNRFAGGGPFWCYFIPDPERDRLLCLDLLVFAPGMEKMDFFRRLDAIASSCATQRPRS